jgi:hypothetical protein
MSDNVARESSIASRAAAEVADAKRQRRLEILAEDCEEMADRLEAPMVPAPRSGDGFELGRTRRRLEMVVTLFANHHPVRRLKHFPDSPKDRRAAST